MIELNLSSDPSIYTIFPTNLPLFAFHKTKEVVCGYICLPDLYCCIHVYFPLPPKVLGETGTDVPTGGVISLDHLCGCSKVSWICRDVAVKCVDVVKTDWLSSGYDGYRPDLKN